MASMHSQITDAGDGDGMSTSRSITDVSHDASHVPSSDCRDRPTSASARKLAEFLVNTNEQRGGIIPTDNTDDSEYEMPLPEMDDECQLQDRPGLGKLSAPVGYRIVDMGQM